MSNLLTTAELGCLLNCVCDACGDYTATLLEDHIAALRASLAQAEARSCECPEEEACRWLRERDGAREAWARERAENDTLRGRVNAAEARAAQAERERDEWKALSEDLDCLLVCYRVGSRPKDKLLDGIHARRQRLAALPAPAPPPPPAGKEPTPTCGRCGHPMSIVRPGKWDCYRDACQDADCAADAQGEDA